jgi:hypothetical protein
LIIFVLLPGKLYAIRLPHKFANRARPWLSWIERQTTNLDVGGSNPPGRANKTRELAVMADSFFIPEIILTLKFFLIILYAK